MLGCYAQPQRLCKQVPWHEAQEAFCLILRTCVPPSSASSLGTSHLLSMPSAYCAAAYQVPPDHVMPVHGDVAQSAELCLLAAPPFAWDFQGILRSCSNTCTNLELCPGRHTVSDGSIRSDGPFHQTVGGLPLSRPFFSLSLSMPCSAGMHRPAE